MLDRLARAGRQGETDSAYSTGQNRALRCARPPHGTWVDATARILDAQDAARGHQLLNQKYGWIKRIGDAVSRLRRRPRVVIAIELV